MVKEKIINAITEFTIDGDKTLLDISKAFGMEKRQARYIVKKHNLSFTKTRRGNQAKTERNQLILDMVKKGDKTYQEIGGIFNISKQRVKQVCMEKGYRRHDDLKEKYTLISLDVIKDVKEGKPYQEIKDKYGSKLLANLKVRGLIKYSFQSVIQDRDNEIIQRYKEVIAKEIVKSNEQRFNDPREIRRIQNVYRVASKNGFKKYPNVGNRWAGGCFENKKVLKFITDKRDKHDWPFQKIANELNRKGYKTVQGKRYQQANVRLKYLANEKK